MSAAPCFAVLRRPCQGLRRRGYTPTSLHSFCKVQGVTKNKNTTPLSKLERCIRMELEDTAKRVYAVVEPVRVVIDNWDAANVEVKEVPYVFFNRCLCSSCSGRSLNAAWS